MLLNRKDKWRNTFITDGNVDEYVQDLCNDTKGRYINQGVSFNKNDSFQMDILKQVFLSHGSFSSLVKHLLHAHFTKDNTDTKEKDTIAADKISENEDSKVESKESIETKETIDSLELIKQKEKFRNNNLSAFTTPED